MAKEQNKIPNSLSKGELEVIKFRQENPDFYKAHLTGLASTYADPGVNYKEMGYQKASKKGNWGNWNMPQNMALKAFEQQTYGELVADTLIGMGKRFGAGFIDSIGALDLTNMSAMAMNKTDVDYSNWFNKVGKKITDNANEENLIYQDPNGSIWNMPYLANQVQQLGYTGGIIAEMLVENAALDWATGGAQNALAVGRVANLMNKGKQFGMGMFQAIKEAHMNALETQNNTYERFKSLGYSEEVAVQKSREAANLHFKTEASSVALLNGIQNALMLGTLNRTAKGAVTNAFERNGKGLSMGISDAVEGVGSRVLDKVTKNKMAHTIGEWGLLAAAESVEEGAQTAIGTYSERTVMGKETSWKDIWEGHEMRDSMIGGALGGVLMGAGFKAVESLKGSRFNKNYKEFLDNTVERTMVAYKAHNDYMNDYNTLLDASERIKKEGQDTSGLDLQLQIAKKKLDKSLKDYHNQIAIASLQYDYGKGNGSTVALEMYKENLEKVKDAVESGDTEFLKLAGILDANGKEKIPGSMKNIVETYGEHIKNADIVKEKMNKVLSTKTTDFDAAANIVNKEMDLQEDRDALAESEKITNAMYSSDNVLVGLSTNAQTRFRLQNEKIALENRVGELSQEETNRLNEIKAELKETKAYTSKESRTIRTAANREQYVSAHEVEIINQRQIEKTAEEVAKASTKEEIQRISKEVQERRLKNAKTTEEVKEVKTEIEDAELSLKQKAELERQAKIKEDMLKAKATQVATDPVTKPGTVKTSEKTAKASGVIQEAGLSDAQKAEGWQGGSFGATNLTEADLTAMGVTEGNIDDAAEYSSRRNTVKDFTPEQKQVLEDYFQYVGNLTGKGKEITFTDAMVAYINETSLERGARDFNGMAKAWVESGRQPNGNLDTIYNSLFSPVSKVSDVFGEVIEVTPEDATATNTVSQNQAAKTTAKNTNYNPITETYGEATDVDDTRTSNADLKFAYNFTNFEINSETGVWERVAYGFKKFQKGEVVTNRYILDKEFLEHIRVNEPNSLKARKLDDNAIPIGTKTTWGVLKESAKAKYGQTAEYEAWFKNNVPVGIIYEGSLSSEPVVISMIHTPGWYNKTNISDRNGDQQQLIQQGRANVTALRSELANSDNVEGLPININRVGFGTQEHTNPNTLFKLKDANPQSKIAIFYYSNADKQYQIETSKGAVDPKSILNFKTLIEQLEKQESKQFVVHLDEVTNSKELGPRYIANITMLDSPIAEDEKLKKDLNRGILNNLKSGAIASMILNNKENEYLISSLERMYNISVKDAENIKETIAKDLNIDIVSDLPSYFQVFLNTKLPPTISVGNFSFENYLAGKKEGLTYLASTGNSDIYVGEVGKKGFKFGGKIVNNSENKTDEQLANMHLGFLASMFREEGLLSKTQLNIDKSRLDRKANNVITMFNSEGKPTEVKYTYEDFLRNHLKTSALSYKIETIDGQEKWVADVQPMIYFSTGKGKSVENPTAFTEDINNAIEEEVQDEDINDALLAEFEEAAKALREAGLSEDQINIARATFLQDKGIFESRLNTFTTADLDSFGTNKINALTNAEQDMLVNTLKHMIISGLDFNGNILKQIQEGLKGKIVELITPMLDAQKNIRDVYSKNPLLKPMLGPIEANIHKLESILAEQNKLNSLVSGEEGALTKEFVSLLSTNFEEEMSYEDNDQEENYSKSFLEKDLKLSFSSQLRLALFGIEEKDSLGNKKVSPLGFTRFSKAEETYLSLMEVTTSIPNSWDMLIRALEKKASETGNKGYIYTDIKNKFEALPQHVKNEILHRTIAKKFTAYKILNKVGKEVYDQATGKIVSGPSTLQLLEEGLASNKVLKNKIVNDFKSSDFAITNNEGVEVLNKVYTEKVVKLLDEAIAKKENNPKKVKELFDAVNLGNINLKTIKYFLEKNGDLYSTDLSILKYLRNSFDKLNKLPGEVLLEENNPFKNLHKVLMEFANIQVLLQGNSISQSVRVGDKTLQGVIANTSLHDIVQRLTGDDYKNVVEEYLKDPSNKNNLVLKLLLEDENFRNNFSKLGFSSPEVYKADGKDSFGEGDIDKLALQDILATKLGIYMAQGNSLSLSKGMTTELEDEYGLSFKVGQMASHTLSDKGRILFLSDVLLDLKGNDISIENDNGVILNERILNYISEQVYEAELARIIQSYKEGAAITAYALSSKAFHYLPSLNSMEIEVDGEFLNIHDFLYNNLGTNKEAELDEEILEKFKAISKEKIRDYVSSELENKISKDGLSGELVTLGFFQESEFRKKNNLGSLVNLNTEYIKNKAGDNELQKLRSTMVEYIINNLLHNVNTHTLYLGDISFYSKNKFIPTTEAYNAEGQVIGRKINSEEIAKPATYVKMAQDIGAALDKRTASLIAPGLKLADSESNNTKFATQFKHVAVQDVISHSSVIKEYVELAYGKLTGEALKQWKTFEANLEIIKTSENSKQVKDAAKQNEGIVKQFFPDIKDYFEIQGTDAQEYVTWRTHLDMLFRQGSKITEAQYNNLVDKLGKNEELNEEEKQIFFQPVKPVYTNLVYDKAANLMRPIYIKSSAFPLLPQMTKNLKIDSVRQKLEKLEFDKEGTFTPVRMSYQTANKIGSLDTVLSMDMLYSDAEVNSEVWDTAISVLPLSGFRIQQETPSKEDKYFHKNKDATISLGSQFMKIILGNFINSGTEKIFPATFNNDILEEVGLGGQTMLSGEELDKVYNHVYFKYSDMLKEGIENELGLQNKDFSELTPRQQNVVMRNLQKLIEKEAKERGYPDYLAKTVEFVDAEADKLEMVSPLFFDVNTHKFEALLQAIVASRLISHKLPGNGHIVGSSEGFSKKATLDELSGADKQGIVWLNGITEELKPTYLKENKDGSTELVEEIGADNAKYTLVKSKVLIKSHYKYYDEEGNAHYADLTNTDPDKGPVYAEDILDENGKVVGKQLKLDMIDKNLLDQFSFRIPTSSHQSGVIIEVAGFLPPNMQDLLIVPKEHTTQLGEDFDIDKRYVYKSNYKITKDGKIEKLKKEHIDIMLDQDAVETSEKIQILYDSFKVNSKEVKERLKNNQKELAEEGGGSDIQLEELMSALFGEYYKPNTNLIKAIQEDSELMDTLQDSFRSDKGKYLADSARTRKKIIEKYELKLLENAMIDVYKAVYSTTDTKIQRDIFKPLTTDVAEDTAFLMDDLLQSESINPNFSAMSDTYQTELIKIGADGKGGIGVHSNAVTFEAQMQRLSKNNKIRLGNYYSPTLSNPEPAWVPFGFIMDGQGSQEFILGTRQKTFEGSRNIADQHGENQNVSTDNINKQIMGKRNENSYTMSAYALLAHMGFDLSTKAVNTGIIKKGKEVVEKLHLPSLFINQPILRDYVKLMEKFNSVTANPIAKKEKENQIIKELGVKYGFLDASVLSDNSFEYEKTESVDPAKLTGQDLWDNLQEDVAISDTKGLQETVLISFLELSGKAQELSKIQQLFNISTSKLGISYFETLDRINTLNELAYNSLEAQAAIEEGAVNHYNNFDSFIGEVSRTEKEGFIKIGNYYWKPTTIEGKMLINSLNVANRLMPIFFPYNSYPVQNVIDTIFYSQLVDPTEKSKANLQWKYEIMSSYKDFISSNIGVFADSLENEKRRLFFNNEKWGNQALGTILQDLTRKGHPIMENRLLKDLEVSKDIKNGVVTIKHSVDENTTLDKSSKYEAFLDLLKDDSSLGMYNGEELTVSKLAQDLVTYSFLTDNQNGATGFKNFVNIDYLKAIGVSKNYRSVFNSIVEGNQDIVDISKRFVDQYFQHHPERAIYTNAKKMKELLKSDSVPTYVYMKNESAHTTTKQYSLYKYDRNEGSFKQLTVLGTTGFNEYDSTKSAQPSMINHPGEKADFFYTKGSKYIRRRDTNKVLNLDIFRELMEGPKYSTVENILDSIYNSNFTSPEYKTLIENITPFINKNVKVEWRREGGNIYNSNTNTIYFNSNIYGNLSEELQNWSAVQDAAREVMLEEIIHSITVNELNEYLVFSDSKTGDFKVQDNAPDFVYKIASAYQTARELNPYNANDMSTYYSKNIHEFIAGMFVSPDYRQNLDAQSEGFIKKFLDALKSMFKFLYSEQNGEILDYKSEIFNAIYDLMKSRPSSNDGFNFNTTPEIGNTTYSLREMKEDIDNFPPNAPVRHFTGAVGNNVTNTKVTPKNTVNNERVEAIKNTIDSIVEDSSNFVLSEDETKYIHKVTGKEYSRVTQFTNPSSVTTPLIKTSQALGNGVDKFIRDYFDNALGDMSQYEFASLPLLQNFVVELDALKEQFEENGETVIPKDVTLYNDELGLAGTVDLLTIDKEGNVRIYDVKSKRAGSQFVNDNKYGKSDIEKWTNQVSLYRILLKNTFGIDTVGTAIEVVKIDYKVGDTMVSELRSESRINIEPKDEVVGVDGRVARYGKGAMLTFNTQQNTKENETNDPIDFVNHSGGAYGGDTMWDQVGREFGVTDHRHYRDAGNTSLSQKLRNAKVEATTLTSEKMEIARAQVEKLLNKKFPNTVQGNLQVRNYYQVVNADAIYAIATPNIDPAKENYSSVKGGTNTAIQLGIKLGKPVYIWSTTSQGWYKYSELESGLKGFIKVETPTLTKNFAGIGTRNIENYNVLNKETNKWEPRKEYLGENVTKAAEQAIRDVYKKTFNTQQNQENVLPTINNVNTIKYTPEGKQTQEYTIEGNKILNSKGVEVFKTDSKDRRKIFANYAVKQGKATVVTVRGNDYVVNDKGQIISVTTGNEVFKGITNGVGKEIRAAADKFFNKEEVKPTTVDPTPIVENTVEVNLDNQETISDEDFANLFNQGDFTTGFGFESRRNFDKSQIISNFAEEAFKCK